MVRKVFISSVFLALIFSIALGTYFQTKDTFIPKLSRILSPKRLVSVSDLESEIANQLWSKNMLIEFSGITRKLLNLHLTDDRQFYKAQDGIVHLHQSTASYELLLDTTAKLAKKLKQTKTPLIICQVAERAAYSDQFSPLFDVMTLEYVEPLKRIAMNNDAYYFDYNQQLSGWNVQDIFFKTDIHLTTEAEFFILQRLVELLEQEVGLHFSNKDIVLDPSQYEVATYSFLGNLGSNTGKIYTGVDQFTYLFPNFDTKMEMTTPFLASANTGTFEQVCMNRGREDHQNDIRTYRVTDYMQWPAPHYTIDNHLVSENRILVLGCSLSMRTMAYLTLLCNNVTVLDPRYFADVPYLAEAMENHYDAVILFASTNLHAGLGEF